MENNELNQLIEAARKAAFFIRANDGYENSKLANELSTLADKVESQKLFAIGRLAARVVMRNSRKKQLKRCWCCGEKGGSHESWCPNKAVDVGRGDETRKGVYCRNCEAFIDFGEMKPYRKDDETIDMLCRDCGATLVEGE